MQSNYAEQKDSSGFAEEGSDSVTRPPSRGHVLLSGGGFKLQAVRMFFEKVACREEKI